jgi:hypothetical protein
MQSVAPDWLTPAEPDDQLDLFRGNTLDVRHDSRWARQGEQNGEFCWNIERPLSKNLERAKGIEPSYAAWEAAVLPLNYARVIIFFLST